MKDGTRLNVALTDNASVIDTVQVESVPEHATPDQPANTEPEAGDSVNVTTVPCANDAEHVVPQLIPDGLDVTVPDPVPAGVTVSA